MKVTCPNGHEIETDENPATCPRCRRRFWITPDREEPAPHFDPRRQNDRRQFEPPVYDTKPE